jgi:replication factor C subunit 2/4
MKYIAQNEGLSLDDNRINYLIDVSEGDLRRSINFLQSISQLGAEYVTNEVIDDICGMIPKNVVDDMFKLATSETTDNILEEANNFLCSGYDLRQFVTQLNEYVANNDDLNNKDKEKVFELLLECETSLLDNSSTNIQLYNLLCGIRKLFYMN